MITECELSPVTCLVGKNESGKTAILQALERLNPVYQDLRQYDKLRDYPRKNLLEYDELGGDGQAVVKSIWTLNDQDVAAVEEAFGEGALTGNEIKVNKGYNTAATSWPDMPTDPAGIPSRWIAQAGATPQETDLLASAKTPKEVLTRIATVTGPSEPLVKLKTRLESIRNQNINLGISDVLLPRMPKFLYFGSYDRMCGNVAVNDLRTKIGNKAALTEGEKVFLAFLEFASTTLDEIAGVRKFEDLRARVEAASISISKQIFQYWTQNENLKVVFSMDTGLPEDPPPFNSGYILRTRVLNTLHDMTVNFDDRSAGFVWFFSFLVLFSQVRKQHGKVIILLDEPGLNLHGKAQGDLLRFIDERLKPHHQVIYTTHSPFMIPDDLTSVRTVEDVVTKRGGKVEVLGTKLGCDVLSTDRDTIFPLQGALGYEIAQSLFVGKHNLLVEGPSDLLYLQRISAELKSRKRTGLDRRWTICPTGGIDKVAAFVALFTGKKLEIAVLTDYAKGQKGKVESLKKSKLLQDGRVFKITDFCAQTEGDIEDLIGAPFYIRLVNLTYSLTGTPDEISESKVSGVQLSTRIVERVSQVMVTVTSAPEFDHYAPALFLASHSELLQDENDLDVTTLLATFERMFEAINKTI